MCLIMAPVGLVLLLVCTFLSIMGEVREMRESQGLIHTLCVCVPSDVNLAARNGNAPLHVAAVNGQLETLRALLDSNANVNATNEEGKTPLHDAAINGRCA